MSIVHRKSLSTGWRASHDGVTDLYYIAPTVDATEKNQILSRQADLGSKKLLLEFAGVVNVKRKQLLTSFGFKVN